MALVTVRRAGGSAGGPAVSAAPGRAGRGIPAGMAWGVGRRTRSSRRSRCGLARGIPGEHGLSQSPSAPGAGVWDWPGGPRAPAGPGSRGKWGGPGDPGVGSRGCPGGSRCSGRSRCPGGCQRGGGGLKVAPVTPGAGSSQELPMGLYWEFTGSRGALSTRWSFLYSRLGFPHS